MFSKLLSKSLSSWFGSSARSRLASSRKGRTPRLRLEPLEDRTLLSAFLVKDINTNTVGSNPSNLLNVNGTLFFSATGNDGLTGLWKSDGTAAGTTLVQEFKPSLGTFVNVNGELFFEVFNPSFIGTRTAQLWKSDGTGPGTQLVKDFTGQYNFF